MLRPTKIWADGSIATDLDEAYATLESVVCSQGSLADLLGPVSYPDDSDLTQGNVVSGWSGGGLVSAAFWHIW